MKNEFVFDYARVLYKDSCIDDLKAFPKSIRNKYYITGDRNDFEKLYFRRRDFLSSCAILSLNDEKYISQLEKIILAICDEYCWALPAHTTGVSIADKKAVDLFVAETGFALAEIITVLDEKISDEVKCRVKSEIRKRLLDNYKRRSFWWESCNMNWASVCGGYVGGALIYLFPEEFDCFKERILNTMSSYIAGFTDEGNCPEGVEYWLYGFSAFTYFADLLLDYTEGEINLFDNEKVRKISRFAQSQCLNGNTTVSFSDANVSVKADMCLQHYLSRSFPDDVPLLPESRMSIWGGNTKWMCLYRTLLWVDDRKENKEILKNHITENQVIIHKDKYSLAVKGGNNDEPHNHNDLGSFILADDNGQALCDLGAGRYTKDYFNNKRYTIFCNSSLSHNVPVIDGEGQLCGKEALAKLNFDNDTITVTVENAYKGLDYLERKFNLRQSSVVLTDDFRAGESHTLVERFVTMRKPEIIGDTVVIGSTIIVFDKEKAIPSICEGTHLPHEYDSAPVTIYCIDFTLKSGINKICFEITI